MTLRSSSSRDFASRSPMRGHELHAAVHLEHLVHAGEVRRPPAHLAERGGTARHAFLEHAGDLASIGAQPRSVDTAARSLPRSAPVSRAGMRAPSPEENGSRLSSTDLRPAAAGAASATVRPIGPVTPNGIRPADAIDARHHAWRRPEARPRRRRPPACAGCRRSRSPSPAAPGPAPAPPPSRPRSRRRSAADRTDCRSAPYTRLVVLEPAPNSGVLVLARMTPPALRTLATLSSSSRGTWSLNSSEPQVVRRPAVACRSLTPIGRPAEQPGLVAALQSPRRWPWPAGAPASASMATMALTAALVFSMRARQLSSSSSGDSLPRADQPPRLDRRQIASLAHDTPVAFSSRSRRPTLTVFVTGRLADPRRSLHPDWRRDPSRVNPSVPAPCQRRTSCKLELAPP